MSGVGLLDKTTSSTETDERLVLTASDVGSDVVLGAYRFSELPFTNYMPEPSLKWTSAWGPMSWTMSDIRAISSPVPVSIYGNVWTRPNIAAMLDEPIGSPVVLSREDALEIARIAFGSNPGLLSGEEFVRKVRPAIGRSILKKLGRAHG